MTITSLTSRIPGHIKTLNKIYNDIRDIGGVSAEEKLDIQELLLELEEKLQQIYNSDQED